MPRFKSCSSCHTSKPLTAFGRRGLDSWCRTCRREYQRRWLAEHREEYNAKHREYYQRNRDQLREYNREYQRRRRALMQAGKWKARRTSAVRAAAPPRRRSARGRRALRRSGARSS
jgi:hypothetical protein